jgi:hypothetical protein
MRNAIEVIRETDRKEVRRYLGYYGKKADAAIEEQIGFCLEEMCTAAEPGAVFRRCGLILHDDGRIRITALPEDRIQGTLMETASKSLARNLQGCCGAYLMAVTLGQGPDLVVRRAAVLSPGKMVICQAAGAAMAEAWCDEVNREIREEASRLGFACRPRFSPGYGDLPLTLQKDFETALEMKKEIGISLTDSLLMVPTKSVTAIIGLTREDTDCDIQGCDSCSSAEGCSYRRT